jgi:hypothetical protein
LFQLVELFAAKDEAVVFVVDPSWDCVESYVAHVPLLQEYKIVKVMTRLGKLPRCNSDVAEIYQNITYNSLLPNDTLATEEICPKLLSLGFPIAAVIATFDPAVYLADRLAACVGARGNPSTGALAKARRDKWVMSEAVRKAGLRSVKEKLVSTWSDAKEHLESLNPPLSEANPVFFKVLQGSSSMGDQIVYSLEQAKHIFGSELGVTSYFGDKITMILIQEYLRGKEYVIDSASRDGVHKTVMVWNEDLRPGNGHFDLYFGFKVMDPKDQKTKTIMEYANKVLDATGLRNGASNMEVMWLEEEGTPCVVDLNPRWSALMWDDGLELEKVISGNDQITATINAYLDGDAFDDMPPVPAVTQHGALLTTQLFHEGILRSIPGLAVVKQLPSYLSSYNVFARAGNLMIPSDMSPLKIILVDKKQAVVDADYNTIMELVISGSFYDIMPLNRPTTSLGRGYGTLPGSRLPAIAVMAILAVAAVLALAARLRRNVQDGTEYLAIE